MTVDGTAGPPSQEEVELDDVIDIDPEQEVMAVSYEITSYGADYPVDGLVKRMASGDIVVPSFDPAYDDGAEIRGFQRRFVWTRPQMDRFVESLLLGLPVPGVFLVRDRQNKLLVLDGQQRLRTLQFYYAGHIGDTRYRLKHAQDPFAGCTYDELEPEDRRRLDDSIIHATVLRQEHPSGSQDAVYSIFERLNTGGSPLQPQEIRVALYHGEFLRGISELNEDPNWRTLYGPRSPRFKDQELILRILALYEKAAEYERPLKTFLNHYLGDNKDRTLSLHGGIGKLLIDSFALIAGTIGSRAFRPVRPVNAAVVDSLTVGLMRRLEAGLVSSRADIEAAYDHLLEDQVYRAATTSSTAAEESVSDRLQKAVQAFEGIK